MIAGSSVEHLISRWQYDQGLYTISHQLSLERHFARSGSNKENQIANNCYPYISGASGLVGIHFTRTHCKFFGLSVEGWGVPYQTIPFLPPGEVTFTIGFRNVDDGIVDRGTK